MEDKPELKNFKDLLAEVILPKIETISIGLLVIAGVFKLLSLNGYLEISNIALTTLAITFFLNAHLFKAADGKIIDTISIKVGYISCSVILIGSMFSILSLSGALEMLTIGLPILGLAITLATYSLLNTNSTITTPTFVRFIVVFIGGAIQYFS